MEAIFFLFEINPISFPELNDGSEYEIETKKFFFLFFLTLNPSLVCQNQKQNRLVTNRRLGKLLSEDIWLPLQEVGELSQTGEWRNIDKRKTNVKTELLIEKGGYENFHLH
jgi:hypothetical protein